MGYLKKFKMRDLVFLKELVGKKIENIAMITMNPWTYDFIEIQFEKQYLLQIESTMRIVQSNEIILTSSDALCTKDYCEIQPGQEVLFSQTLLSDTLKLANVHLTKIKVIDVIFNPIGDINIILEKGYTIQIFIDILNENADFIRFENLNEKIKYYLTISKGKIKYGQLSMKFFE